MRIGIDVRELEKGKRTGIGRYFRQFLSFVSENPSHDEFFLYGNQRTESLPAGSRHALRVIPESCTAVWDQYQLPRALVRDRIDVFLTPYFKAPLLGKTPLVLIVNDLIPLLVPEYLSLRDWPKRQYFQCLLGLAVGKARRVLAISEQTRKDLIRLFQVKAEKVDVMGLAADLSYVPTGAAGQAGIPEKYGIRGHYLYYVGNFKPHKNVRVLIEAYSRLPDSLRQNYRLVVAGQKSYEYDRLMSWVRDLGIQERVLFPGAVADEDMPALYARAAIFVFPSLYEGFGLPVLEAMACGTPVITSDAGSLPEVARDAALLVNPRDPEALAVAMRELLQNPERREACVRKGFERVRNFSVERMVREVLASLRKAVGT